jgi:hypothetical protein
VVLGGDLTFNLGAELGPILRQPVRRPPPQARTAKYSAPHSASQLVTANVKLFTSDWICFFYLPPVAFVRYRSPFFLFLLGRSPSTPDSPIHTHSKPRDATRSRRDGTSCGREQDGDGHMGHKAHSRVAPQGIGTRENKLRDQCLKRNQPLHDAQLAWRPHPPCCWVVRASRVRAPWLPRRLSRP